MKLKQPFKFSYNGAIVTSFEKGHIFTDENDAAYLAAKDRGLIVTPKPKTTTRKKTAVRQPKAES